MNNINSIARYQALIRKIGGGERFVSQEDANFLLAVHPETTMGHMCAFTPHYGIFVRRGHTSVTLTEAGKEYYEQLGEKSE
jgi:histidinol-phosphate/aromatic aminotransferase/cobyric acid decarboxylase-like protein